MKQIRENISNDCPTKDFFNGEPSGNCWGDGHYLCDVCKHYRKDFKENQNNREALLINQSFQLWVLR